MVAEACYCDCHSCASRAARDRPAAVVPVGRGRSRTPGSRPSLDPLSPARRLSAGFHDGYSRQAPAWLLRTPRIVRDEVAAEGSLRPTSRTGLRRRAPTAAADRHDHCGSRRGCESASHLEPRLADAAGVVPAASRRVSTPTSAMPEGARSDGSASTSRRVIRDVRISLAGACRDRPAPKLAPSRRGCKEEKSFSLCSRTPRVLRVTSCLRDEAASHIANTTWGPRSC